MTIIKKIAFTFALTFVALWMWIKPMASSNVVSDYYRPKHIGATQKDERRP
jgi:hypothetical protein